MNNQNHVSSINSFVALQDRVWKTFEYRTISYEDGSTVVRVRGYSDAVQPYDHDGKIESNAELGKQLDLFA